MREMLPIAHVSLWYIQLSYHVTIYLKVLWRAAPALDQNLRSRTGGASTTNDRALFAMFARSILNYQEPGCGDTKLSGKGRGEDTCHMSHVIQVRRKAWVIASMCLEVHNNCSWYQYFLIKSNYLSKLHFFTENYAPVVLYLDWI